MRAETPVPEKVTIGWIGTGVMGSSMCGHLLKAGYRCVVHNRTKEKAERLCLGKTSAQVAPEPWFVARNVDVIFTMVGYPSDVRQVILGVNGVLDNVQKDAVIVDMTTSEPALAREIYEVASGRGIYSVDAPVSGGDKGAREATLSIMVGGERHVFDWLQPLLQYMGKTIIYQGLAGSGQHTKMVNQILIATGMIGVCEALLYGYKAGLDLNTVLASVSGGAAGSWSLSNLAPRTLKGNFDPGFFIKHFLKDMGIALAEARRMRLSLPGLALAEQLYEAAAAQGYESNGTHALLLALADLSKVDWKTAFPRVDA